MVGKGKYKLDLESIKKVLRSTIIFYMPVIMILLDQVQAGNIDSKILFGMIMSISVELLRKFFTDYSR